MAEKWVCKGVPADGTPYPDDDKYPGWTGPHDAHTNYGDSCFVCNLPRAAVAKGGNKPPKPAGKGGGGLIPLLLLVLLALGGGAAWWIWGRGTGQTVVEPSPSGAPTGLGGPGVKLTVAPNAPQRYSSGEQRFWKTIGRQNPDGDSGANEFAAGKFAEAEAFFKKAIDADRNDPEVQIYYENARARQRPKQYGLAVVVPIDTSPDTAAEILRGVADAQAAWNSRVSGNDPLLTVKLAIDSNDPTISKGVAETLVADPTLLAVIGHNASDASETALPVYQAKNIVSISPTSTSASLGGGTFFRTVAADGEGARLLAEFARNLARYQAPLNRLIPATSGQGKALNGKAKVEQVSILVDRNSTYSRSLASAFEAAFTQQGGQVVETVGIEDPSFNAAQKIPSLPPQVDGLVLFPSVRTSPIARAIAKANANSNQPRLLIGGDTLYRPDTLTVGGNDVEGLVLVVPWFPRASEAYAQKVRQRWGGEVGWRTATAYDAAVALGKTINANATPATVVSALRSVTLGPNETAGLPLAFDAQGNRTAAGKPLNLLVVASQASRRQVVGSQYGFEVFAP